MNSRSTLFAGFILGFGWCSAALASPVHIVDLGAGLDVDADSSIISLTSLGAGGTSIFINYDMPGPDQLGETAPGNYLIDQDYFIVLDTTQTITNPSNFTVLDQDITSDESTLSITAYTVLPDGTSIDTSGDFLISGSGLSVSSIGPSLVPLPSAAPLFSAALLGLSGVSYVRRRRKVVQAA